jgi:hypothetical protein
MKRSYIPLSSLCDFFGFESIDELLSKKDSLRKISEEKFAAKALFSDSYLPISQSNFLEFLNSLNTEGVIIFDQWINSSEALKKILLEGVLLENDFPTAAYKTHFLYPSFQKFISPFLWENLVNLLEKPSKKQGFVASYISVLNIESSSVIQSLIEKNIKSEWQKIVESTQDISGEKELILLAGPYFSDEKMSLLNCFTKEFYSQKIKAIDDAMTVFKQPKSNTRIIFWILGQLKKLELNYEHKTKIEEIYKSVKNGDGKYFKKETQLKSKFPFKRVAIFAAITFICAYLIFLSFKPENNWDEPKAISTAFSGFTKLERMQIDSLIQSLSTVEEKSSGQKNDYSYLHLSPVSLKIQERKPFKNLKVEQFIQKSYETQNLIIAGELDSCIAFEKAEINKQTINPFKKLTKIDSKGNKNLYLKNESSFDIIVLVYENSEKGKSLATFVSSKTEINFKVNEGNRLLFIPGKNAGKVSFKGDKEKSRTHFCFIDQNYSSYLQQSYQIETTSFTDLKVLFNEDKSGGFYFIDLNQALKEVD